MDGRLGIHPCVLQDIGPLGPLPKKEEKKLKKKQKKEVLELSDAQIKAHQEQSTAYYLVQNSR